MIPTLLVDATRRVKRHMAFEEGTTVGALWIPAEELSILEVVTGYTDDRCHLPIHYAAGDVESGYRLWMGDMESFRKSFKAHPDFARLVLTGVPVPKANGVTRKLLAIAKTSLKDA